MLYEDNIEKLSNCLKKILNVDFKIIPYSNKDNIGVPSMICSFTDGNNIYISEDWLKNLEFGYEYVTAISHEAFHIFQIKNLREKSLAKYIALRWALEFQQYKSPDKSSKLDYESQSVEMTACIFANRVLRIVCNEEYTLAVKSQFSKSDIDIVDSFGFNFEPLNPLKEAINVNNR